MQSPEELEGLLAERPYRVAATPQPDFGAFEPADGCSCNAAVLADEDPRYVYEEGFAFFPADGWANHAWVVDENGAVLDPTWQDTHAGVRYYEASDLDPFGRTDSLL